MLATFARFLVVVALASALFGIWWPAVVALSVILGVWLLTEAGWLSPEFGK